MFHVLFFLLLLLPAPNYAEEACVCPPGVDKCVCGDDAIFEEVNEAEARQAQQQTREGQKKYRSGYESPALEDHSFDMTYRYLGRTGLRVSELSFGAWISFGLQINVDQAYSIMSEAYKLGINFFDNAETYASGRAESMMGEVLERMLGEEGGPRRSDLVISTKIFWGEKRGQRRFPNDVGLSRKKIVEGLSASLRRLKLDYVDIVFAHRPDPQTPIEETVRAFNFCIDKGFAFYWGTSEWSSDQIREAIGVAERLNLVGPVVEQPEYNVFARERVEAEYARLAEEQGMGLTTWSPLASGILTGKYATGSDNNDARLNQPQNHKLRQAIEEGSYHPGFDWAAHLSVTKQLAEIAEDLRCSVAQLAIAWCLKNEKVSSVILGGTKVDQLRENVMALQVVKRIDKQTLKKIEAILGNRPQQPADFRAKV